jgi:hypothetical protein
MRSKILDQLIPLSKEPNSSQGDWLEGATDSVSILQDNLASDEILLYASGPHLLVHSVLTPNEVIEVPDHDDLDRAFVMTDNSWCIQKVYGGGEEHRIYLEPPMMSPGCKTLVGSEKLIFIRSFHGIKEYDPPIEINQKLVHALDLHYMDERNAYCRLTDQGDIENVITVHCCGNADPWERIRAVTIRSHDLATYMALDGTSLVSLFDFTRYSRGGFHGWDGGATKVFEAKDLFYSHRKMPQHASYANGQIIFRTFLTPEDLVNEWKASEDSSSRQFASFKIIDRKNSNALVETSCSPEHIVNYFTASDLPWEISPAFFRPEVLQKYKSDIEKYTLEARSISCRGAWSLKTFDINDEGQVHTYIGYLADLPYDEQLYWQSFNEWPNSDISERAYQTDILGEFANTDDPLYDLKSVIQELDKLSLPWWKRRGEEMISLVHYPVTDSASEWGNEILALDHIAVEGFMVKPLRDIIEREAGSFDKSWGSLKVLETAIFSTGQTNEKAKELVAPLKELHSLRNPAKAHGDPSGKRIAITKARKTHGTLRLHFFDLTKRLEISLREIFKLLIEKS